MKNRLSESNRPKMTSILKRFLHIGAGVMMIFILNGCAVGPTRPEIEGTLVNGPALNRMKKFYVEVENSSPNERNSRTIEAVKVALTARGGTVKVGPKAAMPSGTECRVVANDHWFWDLGWYLLKLDINLYDARSGTLLGSGSSRRVEPMYRKGPEFMVPEVFQAVFNGSGLGKQ
jgi:hypothetical protein